MSIRTTTNIPCIPLVHILNMLAEGEHLSSRQIDRVLNKSLNIIPLNNKNLTTKGSVKGGVF
jgi:hypothetical protein